VHRAVKTVENTPFYIVAFNVHWLLSISFFVFLWTTVTHLCSLRNGRTITSNMMMMMMMNWWLQLVHGGRWPYFLLQRVAYGWIAVYKSGWMQYVERCVHVWLCDRLLLLMCIVHPSVRPSVCEFNRFIVWVLLLRAEPSRPVYGDYGYTLYISICVQLCCERPTASDWSPCVPWALSPPVLLARLAVYSHAVIGPHADPDPAKWK